MRSAGEKAGAAARAAEAAFSCLSGARGGCCLEKGLVARLSADVLRGAQRVREASRWRLGLLRKWQGVRLRADALSCALFEDCVRVRRAVRSRFRGPAKVALRRAFGEGVPASREKPRRTLALADAIAAAASADPAALRAAGIRPSRVERVKKNRDALQACQAKVSAAAAAARAAEAELNQVAGRLVEDLLLLSEAVAASSGYQRSREVKSELGCGCVDIARKVARLAAAAKLDREPPRARRPH